MTTESYLLEVSDLQVEVVNKDIKNLHISIMPPDGKIRVSAPLNMSEESVRLAIVSRLSKIRREQKSFAAYIRESRKEMISGESHYVDGIRYIFKLIEVIFEALFLSKIFSILFFMSIIFIKNISNNFFLFLMKKHQLTYYLHRQYFFYSDISLR